MVDFIFVYPGLEETSSNSHVTNPSHKTNHHNPSKNHTLHFAAPVVSPWSDPPFDSPSHGFHHPNQVAIVHAVQLTPRTRPTLCIVEPRRLFGCTVAEGWTGVEAHVRLAGLCENDPGMLAFPMLEVCDCTHIGGADWK